MRLLIDGNVVLDVLQNRELHVVESSKVWKLCETEQVEGIFEGSGREDKITERNKVS